MGKPDQVVSHSGRQSDENPSSTFGAVVLAGGLARRMQGQDKGLMGLAGHPMVHYPLTTLLPLVDSCVINANRNIADYERVAAATLSLNFTRHPMFSSVRVVPDELAGHLGPLAGLSAALHALQTDYVFMCPCDSPFLQPELVTDLLCACQQNNVDIAVAHDGERLQPVFCVVHRRVEQSLTNFLAEGKRKIDRWFESHSVVHVAAEHYQQSFMNINTEDDLANAQQQLTG